MKTRLYSIALVATALAVAGCEPAHESTIDRTSVQGLPSVTATESTTAKATVEAIDYDARSVALKGEDGKTEFFQCPAYVRNFYQIKQGDTVQVHYDTKLHVSVRPVSGQPSTTIVEGLGTADPGEKPGCVLYRHVQSEASILSINYETRVVTMRLTTGDKLTVTASDKLPDFDKVKVGDTVIFNYTESLTVDVY